MTNPPADFYWQTSRDNLLTPAALTMFQIAVQYDGQDFDQAKVQIDEEYNMARGRPDSQRHGGNFQTFIRVFEEAGWMHLEQVGSTNIIRVTDAGHQAITLLQTVPDFLKAVPYFLIELFSRYQLNNPTGPRNARNQAMRDAISKSNVFPYWTIYYIMRQCNDQITTEELRRFVFRLHRMEDVDSVIQQIHAFRRDRESGVGEEVLDERYPIPLSGAVRETKYIMGRAGVHIGKHLPVITKPNNLTYELNPAYRSLIDTIIENKPVFQDYLDEQTWMRDYGQPVVIPEEYIPFAKPEQDIDEQLDYEILPDDDKVWQAVSGLVQKGVRNILFVGPPGTSKTWYALHTGARLVEHRRYRFKNIQFHQSFGYEDFMEGYTPSKSDESPSGFILKPKTFLLACNAAHKDPEHLHVLVVDELNRGDPSRIFGEALTYIERKDEQFVLSSGTRAIVPSNLVILATINPYDKSISDIDMAMDRRFAKVDMPPDRDLLRSILINRNGTSPAFAGRMVNFFDYLTGQVENRIGHAYFNNVRDVESLRFVWEYQILPVLRKELRFQQDDLIQELQGRFSTMVGELESD